MSEARQHPPPPLRQRGGSYLVEDVACDEIAASFDTPCFVFSAGRIRDRIDVVRDALAAIDSSTVRYCAKTNHELGVLEIVAESGCEVLVSHRAELELALAAGFAPQRIAYQRPWPPEDDLTAVLDAGVGLVHVHRPSDIARFAQAAKETDSALSVSLRLRPTTGSLPSPLAGLAARSGLDPASALSAAQQCVERAPLRLVGLNRYIGTQQSSSAGLERSIVSLLEIAERIYEETGTSVREINIGGGLPSPALRRVRPTTLWRRLLDRWPPIRGDGLRDFTSGVTTAFRRTIERSSSSAVPRLVVEPGRAIVGGSGLLLTRVVDVDGRWVTCDASSAFLPESPLLFSRPIVALDRPTENDDAERFAHLSGSALNTMDVLDLWRRLPPLRPGDLLAICEAGAYSISRASRYGATAPPVLLVDGGETERIRRSESGADLMRPMQPDGGIERRRW